MMLSDMPMADDGPEIREALLVRAAEDCDDGGRAEALHGLARRHDERAVPYLIDELTRAGEKQHLFVEAAECYLGLEESGRTGVETLLTRLSEATG